MDYKELIDTMRGYSTADIISRSSDAATAIETLLAEREAAVRDLTEVCEDNPDACHLCKHFPCVENNGRCIGWQWRGPTPSDRERTEG